jgi:hypothetical protein
VGREELSPHGPILAYRFDKNLYGVCYLVGRQKGPKKVLDDGTLLLLLLGIYRCFVVGLLRNLYSTASIPYGGSTFLDLKRS